MRSESEARSRIGNRTGAATSVTGVTDQGRTISGLRRAARSIRLAAPFHPILVHFTIALTAASLGFDAINFFWGIPSMAAAGWWALAAAMIVTPGTLATGLTSRLRLPMEEGEARSYLRAHMALGPTFFGLLLLVGIWRAVLWESGRGASVSYLVFAALVCIVMLVQGYLGGELVYRYGAEVEGAYPRLPGRRPKSGLFSVSSANPTQSRGPGETSQCDG